MPHVYIIDIDNTLTMPEKKAAPTTDAQWDVLYQHAIPNDAVIARIHEMVKPGDIVYICTGRKERTRDITKRWLVGKMVYHTLLMREDDDNRIASQAKRKMFQLIKRTHPNTPTFVIDDDAKVRIMARTLGFKAMAPHLLAPPR